MVGGSRSSRSGAAGRKGKEKAEEVAAGRRAEAAPVEELWRPTVIREDQNRELMAEGFFPAQIISQWKMPSRDAGFSYEDNGEVTIFHRYFELCFGLP